MTENPSNKNRRKKLLINPGFQINFMKNLVFMNIGICGIFFASQSYFFWEGRQLGRSIGLPLDHVFFKFIDEQQRSMNIISAVTMVVVSAAIIAFGLLYSHRIAGPIYRMQKYFRERADGTEKGNLFFRQGDYFREVAESVNHYLAVSEKKFDKKDSKSHKKAA